MTNYNNVATFIARRVWLDGRRARLNKNVDSLLHPFDFHEPMGIEIPGSAKRTFSTDA